MAWQCTRKVIRAASVSNPSEHKTFPISVRLMVKGETLCCVARHEEISTGDWTAPGTRQSSLFSWCLFECQRSKLTCFVCVYMCCRFSDDLSEASAVRYSVCAARNVNLFSRLRQVHRDLTWRKSKQKTCSVGTLCSTRVRQHVLDTQGKKVCFS